METHTITYPDSSFGSLASSQNDTMQTLNHRSEEIFKGFVASSFMRRHSFETLDLKKKQSQSKTNSKAQSHAETTIEKGLDNQIIEDSENVEYQQQSESQSDQKGQLQESELFTQQKFGINDKKRSWNYLVDKKISESIFLHHSILWRALMWPIYWIDSDALNTNKLESQSDPEAEQLYPDYKSASSNWCQQPKTISQLQSQNAVQSNIRKCGRKSKFQKRHLIIPINSAILIWVITGSLIWIRLIEGINQDNFFDFFLLLWQRVTMTCIYVGCFACIGKMAKTFVQIVDRTIQLAQEGEEWRSKLEKSKLSKTTNLRRQYDQKEVLEKQRKFNPSETSSSSLSTQSTKSQTTIAPSCSSNWINSDINTSNTFDSNCTKQVQHIGVSYSIQQRIILPLKNQMYFLSIACPIWGLLSVARFLYFMDKLNLVENQIPSYYRILHIIMIIPASQVAPISILCANVWLSIVHCLRVCTDEQFDTLRQITGLVRSNNQNLNSVQIDKQQLQSKNTITNTPNDPPTKATLQQHTGNKSQNQGPSTIVVSSNPHGSPILAVHSNDLPFLRSGYQRYVTILEFLVQSSEFMEIQQGYHLNMLAGSIMGYILAQTTIFVLEFKRDPNGDKQLDSQNEPIKLPVSSKIFLIVALIIMYYLFWQFASVYEHFMKCKNRLISSTRVSHLSMEIFGEGGPNIIADALEVQQNAVALRLFGGKLTNMEIRKGIHNICIALIMTILLPFLLK